MRNMGGLSSLLAMMPGMGKQMKEVEALVDDKRLAQTEAIVLSMTREERQNPKLLTLSRKARIARGAGVDISVVNRFVKQFEESQKMMKQMGGRKGGLGGMFGGGRLPF
jgi:signal recognition particle subunit SRP54